MTINFAILEIIDEFQFLTPLIIDAFGIFKDLLMRKYEKIGIEVVVESCVTDEETQNNMSMAIEEGKIVILENFDE